MYSDQFHSTFNISEEIEKILNDNLLPVQKVTAIDSGDKNEK